MGKIKDKIIEWQEMFDSGVIMEKSRDLKNWFDVTDRPDIDGWWYRNKKIESNESQADDNYLPPK